MKKHRLIAVCLASLVAALVLAGLAAAGASATNLCSEAPNAANKCPMGKAYAAGQNFESHSVNAHLETGLGQIACAESDATMEVTVFAAGLPTTGNLNALSFRNCAIGKIACTVTTIGLGGGYSASVSATGAGNGQLQIKRVGGETTLKAECPPFVCLFTAPVWKPAWLGKNPAETLFEEPEESAACGESEFIGTYVASNPKPVWVTE